MIAVTLAACLAALLFRTPLRSRYWAWQVETASGINERAAPVTHLCNAGDAGRWGTEFLLAHPDEEIRQFGVFVLQHVQSDWARRRLLQMLADPSAAAREMAALGLAIHGDATVIPVLKQMFAGDDVGAASAACLALQRLATPEAVAALATLSAQPADVAQRAALVDALAAVATPSCVAPLLDLLSDHRPCDAATRAERVLAHLAPLVAESGLVELTPADAASQPTSGPAPRTIAERAAETLARITGLSPPFASGLPDQQRQDAARVWRDWVAAQHQTP